MRACCLCARRAHLGGAAAGYALGWLLGPTYVPATVRKLPFMAAERCFRDRPRCGRLAEGAPRKAVLFPALGPLKTVAA